MHHSHNQKQASKQTSLGSCYEYGEVRGCINMWRHATPLLPIGTLRSWWREMAMPGSHRGMMHLQYKGKPFGLMLLLATSAALFGVIAVHKLREKRALGILLKERDRELYELQILLQKERDRAQEIRGKTGEMKDMIYTLSSQKRDLEARIMEMESSISLLKDDHQAMAMTLEDRANDIKTLREKEIDLSKKESEEASLREIVRLKEVEIEDLTRRLDSSMQASNAHQDNLTSPDEKERSENAAGGSQDNNNNNSQDQQHVVMREEVNAAGEQGQSAEAVNAGENNGVGMGNSESGTKLEATEESSEISAQSARHSRMQMSRKRLKRLRAIARNRRMGKRGSQRTVRYTGEDQAQRGNGGEQSAPEAGSANQGFGSPGFNSGDESGTIQNTVSKVEILSEKSAEENHQDSQMGVKVASNDDEGKGAEGENRHSEGDDSGKQPTYSGSNNSEDQGENAGTPEMAGNDGSSSTGVVPAQMENASPIESTENLREAESGDTNHSEANNNWNSFQGTPEENKEEKLDEPDNNNLNSFQGTPEEKEKEKIDEPEF